MMFRRSGVILLRKHRLVVHYGTNIARILMILLAINLAGKISTPEIRLILNNILYETYETALRAP